jgi:hypothetical protein
MTNSTQASIETTANFITAVEDYLNNPPQHNPVISRLLYTEDGAILGVSEDQPPQDYLWQQIDRKKFEQEYGHGPYIWLKMQDGKIINTRPESNNQRQLRLVSGSKWQADKMFRLILDSGDTDGWQERTTD